MRDFVNFLIAAATGFCIGCAFMFNLAWIHPIGPSIAMFIFLTLTALFMAGVLWLRTKGWI